MKQLSEAVGKQDDWTGFTNPATRRKIQNRLHQRAWRRRKATQAFPTINVQHEPERYIHRQLDIDQSMADCDLQLSTDSQLVLLPKKPYVSPYSTSPKHSQTQSDTSITHKVLKTFHGQQKIVPPLLQYQTTTTPSAPPHTLRFPLPVDHHLITLVQYNVLRGSITNMAILNILHQIPTECSSALSLPPSYDPPSTIPPSLYPTSIQLSIPHDSWMDVFPCKQMRDNLILNQGNYDPDDLCCDTSGGLWEGFNDVEMRGLFIWGEPWSEEGWEVTEGFVKKWGWTLKGCTQLIQASNRWREARGEESLVVEV